MTREFAAGTRDSRTPPFLLRRGAGGTPWFVWPLALAGGILTAQAAASPAVAGAILGGGVLLALAWLILSRPILGFAISLAFFPFYTLLRGVAMVYNLPLPYTLLGIWPEVVLCVMAVSLILRDIRAGKRRLRVCDIPVAVMMAGSIYALSLTVAEKEWSAALYGAHASITGFAFYFVARSLDVSREDLRLILRIWLISFALLAIFSLWDYFYRPAFFIEVAIKIRDQFWKSWDPHVFFKWYPRMQSLLYGEQIWGTICAIVAVYCAALWGQQKRIGPRRWVLPLYALALIGLTLSMSRGALACWGVAMLVLFLMPGRHKILLAATALIGAGVLTFLILRYSDHDIIRPLTERVTALLDTDNRLAYDRVDQMESGAGNFPAVPVRARIGAGGRDGALSRHGGRFFGRPRRRLFQDSGGRRRPRFRPVYCRRVGLSPRPLGPRLRPAPPRPRRLRPCPDRFHRPVRPPRPKHRRQPLRRLLRHPAVFYPLRTGHSPARGNREKGEGNRGADVRGTSAPPVPFSLLPVPSLEASV